MRYTGLCRWFWLLGFSTVLTTVTRGQSALGSGSIAGTVMTNDGTSVREAIVYYTRISQWVREPDNRLLRVHPELDVSGVQHTDTTGRYKISSLPDGQYSLCAQAPLSTPYLDSCTWGPALAAQVATGETVKNKDLRLQPGAIVRIRINDPLGLLPAEAAGLNSPPHMIVGVRRPSGAFYPARTVLIDKGGRELAITAPFDTPLYFWVSSNFVQFLDDKGGAVDNRKGARIPFQVPTGTSVKQVTFQIAGPL